VLAQRQLPEPAADLVAALPHLHRHELARHVLARVRAWLRCAVHRGYVCGRELELELLVLVVLKAATAAAAALAQDGLACARWRCAAALGGGTRRRLHRLHAREANTNHQGG
jgi:hypothetical protein